MNDDVAALDIVFEHRERVAASAWKSSWILISTFGRVSARRNSSR